GFGNAGVSVLWTADRRRELLGLWGRAVWRGAFPAVLRRVAPSGPAGAGRAGRSMTGVPPDGRDGQAPRRGDAPGAAPESEAERLVLRMYLDEISRVPLLTP